MDEMKKMTFEEVYGIVKEAKSLKQRIPQLEEENQRLSEIIPTLKEDKQRIEDDLQNLKGEMRKNLEEFQQEHDNLKMQNNKHNEYLKMLQKQISVVGGDLNEIIGGIGNVTGVSVEEEDVSEQEEEV